MLIVISRTTKKKISGKTTKRNRRKLPWYPRKYLFKIKEGTTGEIEKQKRHKTFERKTAKWQR